MINYLSLFFKSCLIILAFPFAVHAKSVDLFVLAGQSNMQGYMGDALYYPVDKKGLDEHILFYWQTLGEINHEQKWSYLQPQQGRFPKGHFGPEITFSRKLLEAGYQPAIFKFTSPGTRLNDHWKKPGKGGLYDDMINELNSAIEQLHVQGYDIKFRALIWVQGESDADTKELSNAYGNNLRLLVSDFRKNVIKDSHLPIILGVDEAMVKNNPDVLLSQKQIASEDPNIVFTSMIGLKKADFTHLTPLGIEYHGQRLFDGYLKSIDNKKHIK